VLSLQRPSDRAVALKRAIVLQARDRYRARSARAQANRGDSRHLSDWLLVDWRCVSRRGPARLGLAVRFPGRFGLALASVLLALLATGAAAGAAAPVTLYAAPTLSGSASCGDPADACTLANALSVAVAHEAGDAVTIQLAAGTYAPATISAGTARS